MTDIQELKIAVADLAQVTHQLAGQLQKLAIHVERETKRMPEPAELPVILSELSELHRRLTKLSTATA